VATEAVRKALGVTGDCACPECCPEAAWAERAALAADMAAWADERCRRAAERWPALAGWRGPGPPLVRRSNCQRRRLRRSGCQGHGLRTAGNTLPTQREMAMVTPPLLGAANGRPMSGPADEAAWLADQRRRWAARRAWLAELEKQAVRLRAVRRGGGSR